MSDYTSWPEIVTTLEAQLLRATNRIDELRADNERLREALDEGRIACEPFDDVKPRRWITDYKKLAVFHQHAVAAFAAIAKEKP